MIKRVLPALLSLVLVFIASTTSAQDESAAEGPKKFYLGLGLSYAISNIKLGQQGDAMSVYENVENAKLGNAKGFNAKLGFLLKDDLFWEIDLNYLHDFYWERNISTAGVTVVGHEDVDILTVIFSGKYLFPLDFWGVQPYLTAGVGAMYYSDERYFVNSYFGYYTQDYPHDFQPCIKAGLGVEYPITNAIAVTVEASYVKAFLRLDYVNYYNLGANILFYF